MSKSIPTYQLDNLSNDALEVFLLDKKVGGSRFPFNIPYRSSYYGVGICVRGKAELMADLETYTVGPNCVVAMSPQIIKQWTYMSDDFKTLSVFFTKDFIAKHHHLNLDMFPFLENGGAHCFEVSDAESDILVASLDFLQQKYEEPHPFRDEVLRNLIAVLLLDVAAIYDQQLLLNTPALSRSQKLASDFKKLISGFLLKERSVTFYAGKLAVTPRHLSQTVKEATGKTAGEWIDETVILEAKVLLLDASLSIAQIADLLCFPDQSAFGKFFKNITGLSPIAYRKSV